MVPLLVEAERDRPIAWQLGVSSSPFESTDLLERFRFPGMNGVVLLPMVTCLFQASGMLHREELRRQKAQ